MSASVCITHLVDCTTLCEHGDCSGDQCVCDHGWEGEYCKEGDTLVIPDLASTDIYSTM